MEPGRNDPCPCGSGKKYKKCCELKERGTVVEYGAKGKDLEGAERDEKDDREMMLRMARNLHKLILDRKPHIKEYYKIRKLHGEIIDAMVRYHDNGKFTPQTDDVLTPKENCEPVVYLQECEFDLASRAGAQSFYDIVVYKPAPYMNCITEDFIQKHRYKKLEKIEFLQSMLNSRLGLFEVTGTDFGEGYAYLKDVFTGDAYTIIDIGLSGGKNYDRFYIYTRIITYNGINFGTGLNLIFDKTDKFIKDYIERNKKNYDPDQELMRLLKLYKWYSKCPDKIEAMANAWE